MKFHFYIKAVYIKLVKKNAAKIHCTKKRSNPIDKKLEFIGLKPVVFSDIFGITLPTREEPSAQYLFIF